MRLSTFCGLRRDQEQVLPTLLLPWSRLLLILSFLLRPLTPLPRQHFHCPIRGRYQHHLYRHHLCCLRHHFGCHCHLQRRHNFLARRHSSAKRETDKKPCVECATKTLFIYHVDTVLSAISRKMATLQIITKCDWEFERRITIWCIRKIVRMIMTECLFLKLHMYMMKAN